MTIKEKIMKIMSLALEINPPEIEEIGENRTAVFVNWFPHCNLFDVSIYYGGYRSEELPDVKFYVYCDRETSSEELDEIILTLEKIKADLTVDNSELNSEIAVVENSEPDSVIEPVEDPDLSTISDPVENITNLTLNEINYLQILLGLAISDYEKKIPELENLFVDCSLLISQLKIHIDNYNIIYKKLESLYLAIESGGSEK